MGTQLLLIDLSSIAHAQFHLSGTEPDPDWTAKRTVARVHALASGMPSGVAIAIDSPPYFRKDIDPAYKANRTKEHAATVGHQIAIAIDALKADGFPVWGVRGYEADDIIATAVARIKYVYSANDDAMVPPSLLIATADKDMCQLVSDRVSIFNTSPNAAVQRYDPESVKTKFGVVPNQMVDYLALVGDKSDNVTGAKNIGAVTAAKLLIGSGNLDDLYRAIDGGLELTPKLLESLEEFRPRMETVRSLIRLRTDAPIPFEDIFKERVPVAVDGDMAFASDHEETMTDERREVLDNGRQSTTDSEAETEAAHAVAANQGQQDIQGNAEVDDVNRQPQAGHHVGNTTSAGGVVRDGSVGAPPQTSLVKQGVVVDQLAPLPDDWRHQLEPRSYKQLKDAALDIAASKHYANLGSPSGVLATIAAGRELGMHMMASLRAFHIIEGKPAMSADLIRAIVIQSPLCEYFRIVERTPTQATWKTKRVGDEEVSLTYTIEQGRQAWQKDEKAWLASAWGKRPINMVTKTASSELCRLIYPDVVMNLYSVEELGGEDGTNG